jgi:superfamily I DNA/RNA helicase
VVGDDDQSIYSWRGADPTHILEFSRHYPEARTITLDQNYRSTSSILDAANAVIANNSKRHAKKLWSDRGTGTPLLEVITEDDRGEAEFVAKEIFSQATEQNRPWKHFAILYRSNAQSRIFEEALRRHRIPYKIVGGMSFLDRKEVKDVLSYWRLIVNHKDDASLRRVLNWPARGIGKTTAETLYTKAFQNELSIFDTLSDSSLATQKNQAALLGFRDLISELKAKLVAIEPTPEGLANWGRHCLERIGAKKAVEEETDDPVQFARKWENVEELVHSLGQIDKEELEEHAADPTMVLQEFLNRMTLEAQDEEDDDSKNKESDANQVTLLTLHGAKGLEYPIVFLVGLEEGLLPHKRTIEEATDFSEERRLCYVGITRAKDHLFLTRARNRIRYGKPVPRYRSRFMNEIPAELLTSRDESHGPDKTDSAEARQAHEQNVLNHLASIRAMLSK